ncbi:MAG: hypothetical protein ACOCXQ_02475 [Patescibacteria group bacterium]
MIISFILLFAIFFISRISIQRLALLLYSVTKSQSITNLFISVIFFPGTLIHETAHLVAALVLLLPVRGMTLIPEWDDQSIKLGHVTYVRKDPIRGILVGIAPLFGGVGIVWLLLQVEWFATGLIPAVVFWYLMFTISSNMFSSKQDLVDAIYLIPILLVGILALYLFGGSIPALVRGGLELASGYANESQAFFSQLNKGLVFSLFVHGIFVGVSLLVAKR